MLGSTVEVGEGTRRRATLPAVKDVAVLALSCLLGAIPPQPSQAAPCYQFQRGLSPMEATL